MSRHSLSSNFVATAELSDVIGAIYDSAVDPERWEGALDRLKDILGCCNAQLGILDLTNRRGALMKSVGVEPHWLQLQINYYAEIAEWERLPVAYSLSPDEPQVRSRLLPAEMVATSPYISEWCEPQGVVDAMALTILHTPTRNAQVGLGRHRDQGLIGDREVEIARLLIPHVRRAVTISDILDLRALESAVARETLDALRVGVVLTGDSGRILHANPVAERMFRDGGPIRSVGGKIDASLPGAAAELKAAATIANGSEAALGKTGYAVRLTRRGDPAVLAHVMPLAQGDTRASLFGGAVAAIFISSATDGTGGAEAMAVAYDLTRMETRVLAGLLGGQTLAGAATALGIAESTAKTHLGNLFAKTGVARQAELVRLAMQLASPAAGTPAGGEVLPESR